MIREETMMIMGVLKTAYPNYYRSMKRDEAEKTIALWTEMFADEPAELVVNAVKVLIATDEKGFPPHIGAVKAHIARITGGVKKSEYEAWGEVKRALSNSVYHAADEFEKLDPVIKRIVGSPSQLREWAQAETETLDTVISSNFQRSYRACEKNYRESLTLPSAVSEFVHTLAESKSMNAAQEPKSLPVSVKAIVNEFKETVKPPVREIPKPLTEEEFAKKRAEILRSMGIE